MRNGLIRLSRAALCVAACFGVAQAAPTLPKVVAGQASFSQDGNVFSITNTPDTIINWQSFSVNAGEVTRFIQQGSDSAVLNRIVGQDPSRILGALQSNGKVFLINPNGVVFGRDARVDVGGLVASTLNMTDADFLDGKKSFTGGPNAGKVSNEGAITTPSGGQVFLVAPNVENSGVITAPDGEVVLAAGRSVQLVDSANPDLSVVVSAPSDAAINLGQVVANGGRIGIYGALINQRGVVNANSATVGQDGRIFLKASQDVVLEAGSVTTAHSVRAEADNELTIGAALTANEGDIDLRAKNHLRLLAGGALASPNYIDLKSGKMTLTGMIGGVEEGGQLPIVSFNTFSNTTGIFVNTDDVSGALTLDPARLGAFKAYGISIGNSGHTGDIVIDDALTLAGNLVIDTAGRVALNAPVLLNGDTSQFLAKLHAPGSSFQVSSNSAIDATRKIGVSGAGRIHIDGKLNAGEIALDAGSAGIELTADVTAASRVTLRSDGTLNQGGSVVKSPELLAEAGSVNMLGNNDVGTLAGAATGTGAGAGFRFRWTNALRIGSVGERAGLSSPGEVSLTGGDLAVDAAVEAPTVITVDAASIKGSGTLASNVLSLQSRGGIGEATRALKTSANVLLNAKNTGTGSAPIHIVNDRALSIGNVVQEGAGNGGAIAIETTGGLTVAASGDGQGVRTGSGDISLVTHSPLTIKGKVGTDSGNVRLVADNGGLLTIDGAGRVASGSGSVSVTAGDTVIVAGSIVVASADKLSVVRTNPPKDPQPTPPEPAPPEPAPPEPAPPEPVPPEPVPPEPAPPEPTPPLDTCLSTPGASGCSGVIEAATRSCMANPEGPQCTQVLPPVQTCRSNPSRLGCSVVMQREEIRQCIATPTAPGCGETLPPLASCRVDAGLYGCAPVLARAEFLACVASPGAPGCAARLPALGLCKATPGIEGCAQVIQQTFTACLAAPNDPSCSGILPTLSQCVSDKTAAGCQVVLPTLKQCIGSPTLQGCSVQLPKLEQCAVNPNQAGCEAVLPKPGFCSTHPLDASCAVFNPAPSQGGGESKQPVAEALQNTVALINTRTPAQEKLPAVSATAGAAEGTVQGTDQGTAAEQQETAAGPAAGTNTGVKNEKPATKMYCN